LQHPPEKILEMYRLWQQGYQVVEGIKANRGKENPLRAAAAKTFYRSISGAIGVDMSRASDFKLLDRRAVDTLLAMREKNAFFRALSCWIGFSTAQVEFEVQPRLEGKSKWSLRALVKYAASNITSFSAAPLQLVTILGVGVFIASVVLGVHTLWQKFTGQALEGFTTVILLQLFLGSVLMICLGIIGYYIAKIYEEIKARPRYIVAERSEDTPNDGQA
jgi:dolichol-phosphate mannosyltransferase